MIRYYSPWNFLASLAQEIFPQHEKYEVHWGNLITLGLIWSTYWILQKRALATASIQKIHQIYLQIILNNKLYVESKEIYARIQGGIFHPQVHWVFQIPMFSGGFLPIKGRTCVSNIQQMLDQMQESNTSTMETRKSKITTWTKMQNALEFYIAGGKKI